MSTMEASCAARLISQETIITTAIAIAATISAVTGSLTGSP